MDCIQYHKKELELAGKETIGHSVNRRVFMQVVVGLAASSSAFLTACDTITSTTVPVATSIDVLTVWSGNEANAFKQVTDNFKHKYHITVNIESTRDEDAILTSRIGSNNPPDIAVLPNPGKVLQLAQRNNLIQLDEILDMKQLRKDYDQSWIDISTYNNNFYALPYKASNKSIIWYDPSQFAANGYAIPKTWTDLLKLSNRIVQEGRYPWSMGVEDGAASGWPAADWIAEIYLRQSGPGMYDQWVKHKIPWTHSSVKNAFQAFGKIVNSDHYIDGKPQSILTTDVVQSCYAPFDAPPEAYMFYLGDFAAGFITAQFKDAQPGTDFDFFPFPIINPLYKNTVTGGADMITAMKDNTAVRTFLKYLASAEAQEIWVKLGGFTSPNKAVSLEAYPDEVAKKSAQMLTQAEVFRFGAGDLMPSQVQQEFWRGILTFIGDQTQLNNVLVMIEQTARQAYQS